MFNSFFISEDMDEHTGDKDHFHNFYSIGILTKGGHSLYSENRDYQYGTGDIRIINPHQIHHTIGSNWRYINISIDKNELENVTSDVIQNTILNPIIFDTKITDNRLLRIVYSYMNADKLEKDYIEKYFIEFLFSHHSCKDFKVKYVNHTYTKKEIDRAKEYIHLHFNDPSLTIEKVSSSVSLSPFYFIRTFKKYYGITPHRYIQNLKLEDAYNQIFNSRTSLSHIAYGCGFSDQSHMNRVFKKYYGFTPDQFR